MAIPYRDEAEAEGEGGGDELDAAFEAAAMEAFPEKEWDDMSLAAFKEAIRICLEKDQQGAYGAPPKKGGVDLIVALGGKGKK